MRIWRLGRRRGVVKDGLGRFTYDPSSPLVTADTVYDVASITKVVATTAAAMLLVQRGEIDVELTLGELLPGFVAGRAAEGSGAARDAETFAGAQFGLAGVCGAVSQGNNASGAFSRLAWSCRSKLSRERGLSIPIRDSSCLAKRWRSGWASLWIHGSGARFFGR